MEKQSLKNIAAAFLANADAKEYFATSNGSCFEKNEDAINYAKELTDATVTKITRKEVTKEIEEVVADDEAKAKKLAEADTEAETKPKAKK